MFPSSWQEATLEAHRDLYRRHEQGFTCLRIAEGKLQLGSLNQAPFGLQPLFDPSAFGA
jgi:hypothetical protein